MATQNTPPIPIGKGCNVTLKAFDGATPTPNDITATGSFTASSDNTAAVTVSQISAALFAVQCVGQGTANVTWKFTNPSGSATDVDTINPPDPPVSVTSSYSAPV